MTIHLLSLKDFAERIGVKKATLSKYKMPPPDAMIGNIRGWLPESVDQWQQRRPGRGRAMHDWELPEGYVDPEVEQELGSETAQSLREAMLQTSEDHQSPVKYLA